MRKLLATLALVMLAACKGADGATGPQGPAGPAGGQGPTGPQGPAGAPGSLNRADLTGTFGASGAVNALLPASAVANGRVPVIACYISDVGQAWIAVAQTPATASAPYCGLDGIGTATPSIRLINGFAGFRYYIIAVW